MTQKTSTFDLIKRIEAHVLAIRRAPFSAAISGRGSIVIAEQELAAVVAIGATCRFCGRAGTSNPEECKKRGGLTLSQAVAHARGTPCAPQQERRFA